MKLSKFIEGVSLLSAHYSNLDGYHIDAEHDQFFMHPTDTPLSHEEFTKLCSLGWFQDEVERDDNWNFEYDKDCGWCAHV